MILTGDIHLRPESADTVFAALDAIYKLAEKGDKRVAILGDVWHVRYALPVELLNRLFTFLEAWSARDVETFIIPGNHDQITVNGEHALLVLGGIENVHVYTEPTDGWPGLWLPYRKDVGALLPPIEKSTRSIAFAHHGIVGAMMNNHVKAGDLDGIQPALFQKFQNVFLAHWHRHQQIGNCVYVGSPYQTRSDEAGQQKGVVDLNVQTGAWKFIPLDVGPKFWVGLDAAENVKVGDTVKLPAGVAPDLVEKLRAQGVNVNVEPPKVETSVRVANAQSMRDYALAYVKQNAGGLDENALMHIFDEVVSS